MRVTHGAAFRMAHWPLSGPVLPELQCSVHCSARRAFCGGIQPLPRPQGALPFAQAAPRLPQTASPANGVAQSHRKGEIPPRREDRGGAKHKLYNTLHSSTQYNSSLQMGRAGRRPTVQAPVRFVEAARQAAGDARDSCNANLRPIFELSTEFRPTSCQSSCGGPCSLPAAQPLFHA